MSEYKQVDLQIGTEAQFETKKANLSEGVIVGLTDPIHENELDSDLQTKLDGIKKVYMHNVRIDWSTSDNNYYAHLQIISTTNTEFTSHEQIIPSGFSDAVTTIIPCLLYDNAYTTYKIIVAVGYDTAEGVWGFTDIDGANYAPSTVNIEDTVIEL